MAKVRITKKDGTATPYFFSDKEGSDQSRLTVYKQKSNGVARMKGVHFDAVTKRIVKD